MKFFILTKYINEYINEYIYSVNILFFFIFLLLDIINIKSTKLIIIERMQ